MLQKIDQVKKITIIILKIYVDIIIYMIITLFSELETEAGPFLSRRLFLGRSCVWINQILERLGFVVP